VTDKKLPVTSQATSHQFERAPKYLDTKRDPVNEKLEHRLPCRDVGSTYDRCARQTLHNAATGPAGARRATPIIRWIAAAVRVTCDHRRHRSVVSLILYWI